MQNDNSGSSSNRGYPAINTSINSEEPLIEYPLEEPSERRAPQAAPSAPPQSPAQPPVAPALQLTETHRVAVMHHQKQVKCWSKTLLCLGYFAFIMGVVGLFFNVLGFFWLDKVTDIKIPMETKTYYLRLSCFSAVILQLIKCFQSMLCIKQGGQGIKLFKPILKEYRDAQNGVTNGITMYERKSKLMEVNRFYLRKFTCLNVCSCLIALPLGISMMDDAIDQIVPIIYEQIDIHDGVIPADNSTDPFVPPPPPGKGNHTKEEHNWWDNAVDEIEDTWENWEDGAEDAWDKYFPTNDTEIVEDEIIEDPVPTEEEPKNEEITVIIKDENGTQIIQFNSTSDVMSEDIVDEIEEEMKGQTLAVTQDNFRHHPGKPNHNHGDNQWQPRGDDQWQPHGDDQWKQHDDDQWEWEYPDDNKWDGNNDKQNNDKEDKKDKKDKNDWMDQKADWDQQVADYFHQYTQDEIKDQWKSAGLMITAVFFLFGLGIYLFFQSLWVLFVKKAQASQVFLEGIFMGFEVANAPGNNRAPPSLPQTFNHIPPPQAPVNNTGLQPANAHAMI